MNKLMATKNKQKKGEKKLQKIKTQKAVEVDLHLEIN